MNSRAIAFAVFLVLGSVAARADILGYYPLNETSGSIAPNVAGTAPNGTLFGDTTWFTDATRGQVLRFDGAGDYADLGSTTIPLIGPTTQFTWSFWAYSEAVPSTAVVLGNRYSPSGAEFSPREFIKFTSQKLEFHRNATGEDLDYADFAVDTWAYHTAVQNGPTITYFRDGHYAGRKTITASTLNPQPLYLGGNATTESWKGRIDDVALWTNAIPVSAVAKLAAGTATPATVGTSVPVFSTQMSDNFSAPNALWNATNRGLENNAPAGYNAPNISGGTLTLGGTTTNQYWYGSSFESAQSFSSSLESIVSVDRISLSGSGSAFRSSLWILGDNGHYLHFSQNFNEGGWSFNARDDGGLGGPNATGAGINIAELNPLDGDIGSHNMAIQLVPLGAPGQVWMYLLLDGQIYADQRFTNFPSTFNVVLTGQARATGDSVSATFDNLVVQQVPEPGSALLFAAGLGLVSARRRRSAP
jgi:hypothetical protein